jgi:hypothetical protein
MAFAWTPTGPQDGVGFTHVVEPVEVLYDFDGPMLFVSRGGPFPLLCYKIDESEDQSQYILTPTNEDVVKNLRAGKIALRTALSQSWMWVVVTDSEYRVKRSWSLSPSSFPDDVLPEAGFGIYHEHGVVDEKAAQAESAFLSIKFRGGDIRNGTIPFGVLKNAVDEAYESLWRIFAPAVSKASKKVTPKTLRRVVSIPTHEFAIASLLITIDKPEIDLTGVKSEPEVDVEAANQNIAKAQNEFLKSADAIARAVERDELSSGLASDHFDALEAVTRLIPSQGAFFTSVEINGRRGKKKAKSLIIDVPHGRIIKDIYKSAMRAPRTVEGEIFLVNSHSHKFTIGTGYGEVTCVATTETQRERIATLRSGMRVSVHGYLERRPLRDLLRIQTFSIDGFTTS